MTQTSPIKVNVRILTGPADMSALSLSEQPGMVFKPEIVAAILHHGEARYNIKLMGSQRGQTGCDDIAALLNQLDRETGPTSRPFC